MSTRTTRQLIGITGRARDIPSEPPKTALPKPKTPPLPQPPNVPNLGPSLGVLDWTNAHMEELEKGVDKHGFKWTRIAASNPLLKGWRSDALFDRYWRAVNHATPADPPPSKKWTAKLDTLFKQKLSEVWETSPRPWSDLAEMEPFSIFTPVQLHEHWKHFGDPLVQAIGPVTAKGLGWGVEEDNALLEEVKKQGPGRVNFKRVNHPLLTCYSTNHLRIRYSELTRKKEWSPEEDKMILAFAEDPVKSGRGIKWAVCANKLGGTVSATDVRLRFRSLSAGKLKTGAFTAEEDEVIVQALKHECNGFDLRKKQPQKGRDLYDIVGDVDFNSRLWNELGEKLNRDARNVEIRAFRIWNLAQTNGTGVLRQLTDEEYQELEVYLDELKRGVNPEWGKLSLKFKIPSRLICNRLLCRKIYTWNSTADTVLKNLVDQVLEEATIQTSTDPTVSLSHSASGASKVVPPTLLETSCLSSTSLPLPPPKPHPPYTTLNLNGISALKLFQTSESNLNKRIDYAFIRSGFHLKAKPSFETPHKTYPSSTSPLDTIQPGDDAISLGGITAKRMTTLTDFYTQFSHVIPWDVVSTRVNKHLEGLEFAGSAYNCLASERLKGVNGKWVVRRREDGKPSNAGIKGVAFSMARCQRRWVGLMREGIWNTSKW